MNTEILEKELDSISGGVGDPNRVYEVGQIYANSSDEAVRIIEVLSDSCNVEIYQFKHNKWTYICKFTYPFSFMDRQRDVTDNPQYADIKNIRNIFGN